MGGMVPRRPGGGGGPTEHCSGAPLRGYHHHGPAVEPHTQPVQTAPPTAMSSDTSASTRQQPQAAGLQEGEGEGEGGGCWLVTLGRCGDNGYFNIILGLAYFFFWVWSPW